MPRKRKPGRPVTTNSRANPLISFRVSDEQLADLRKTGKKQRINAMKGSDDTDRLEELMNPEGVIADLRTKLTAAERERDEAQRIAKSDREWMRAFKADAEKLIGENDRLRRSLSVARGLLRDVHREHPQPDICRACRFLADTSPVGEPPLDPRTIEVCAKLVEDQSTGLLLPPSIRRIAGYIRSLSSTPPSAPRGPSQDFLDGQAGALHNAAMVAYDMGRPDIRHAINQLFPVDSPQRPIDTPVRGQEAAQRREGKEHRSESVQAAGAASPAPPPTPAQQTEVLAKAMLHMPKAESVDHLLDEAGAPPPTCVCPFPRTKCPGCDNGLCVACQGKP